jgi:hypothetical protein
VLVGAYLLVRCVHLTVHAVAATGDAGLRRQVAITWLPPLAGGALLVAGALLGGWTQTLLFAGALLVQGVGVYLTATALLGGVALYLAGQLLFKRRMHNALSLPRLVATGVLVAALPAAVLAPPLVGLAGLVLILAALIVVETTPYAQVRRDLRGAWSPVWTPMTTSPSCSVGLRPRYSRPCRRYGKLARRR